MGGGTVSLLGGGFQDLVTPGSAFLHRVSLDCKISGGALSDMVASDMWPLSTRSVLSAAEELNF